MKLSSPIVPKKARIEIIPLIDIMFFLLACFMLVSLSMVQMRGMKINLPTAANTAPEHKSDFVTVTVDALGAIYLEKDPVDKEQLYEGIKKMFTANPDVRIYIRGDKDALHGEVVEVLDRIRSAGPQKVAFELKAQSVGMPKSSPASSPAAAPSP